MSDLLEKLKKMGKSKAERFMFEFYLETNHEAIIEALKKYLKSMTTEDAIQMIKENRFPDVDVAGLSKVTEYYEFFKSITPLRLLKALAEARPDLVQVIQSLGQEGANWVVNLRARFLELVKNPTKEIARAQEYSPNEELIKVTCELCKGTVTLPKSQAEHIDKCPLCGK